MDTLEIAAKMVRDAVSAMSVKFSALVKGEINAQVSSLYKPGGAATLATLPALTADNAGYVYDMTEAFATTANFREGAGHKYPAGTNVVISDVGDDVYKYDVLSGMLDGYVQESRKVGNVPLSADIPVTLTGDTVITVTNTGTASAIGYSISHDDSGVTAGSKGDTTNQTPGFGETFKVLSATADTKGHVTALGDHTVKIPDAEATQSAKGLMSPADKTKLDTLVDDTLSATGKASDAKATGDAITFLHDYLKSMEIYRTASGNPATFSDAKAANVKELVVTITPTQAGSGDPYPPGGGKNLLNLADVPSTSYVTATYTESTHSIKITSPSNVNYSAGELYVSLTANVTYTLSAYATVTKGVAAIGFRHNTQGRLYASTRDVGSDGFMSVSYTPTENITVRISLFCTMGEENPQGDVTYRDVQLEIGSSATEYAPYSNIRPITGVSSVTVTRTGQNGANSQTVTVQLTDDSNPLTVYGGTLDVTNGVLTVDRQFVLISSQTWNYTQFYSRAYFVNRTTYPSANNGVCSCYPTSASVYAPLSTDFDIVFGTNEWSGSSGRLQTAIRDNRFSSAADFVAAMGDQSYVIPVAPLTYQLTPQQLATLSGYNAVSTDAERVDVTYKADPVLSLGGGGT